MNASEFTEKRRKKVELPDGSTFVIRKIGVTDMLLAGGSPDLSVFLGKNGQSDAQRLQQFADNSARHFERIQKDANAQREFCAALVIRAVVQPRITKNGEGDSCDVNDFTFEELDLIAGGILKFSGFGKGEAEDADPLLGTEAGASASMDSPDDTTSDPVSL